MYVDASQVRAKGAEARGPSPIDWAKTSSMHPCDLRRQGVPLVVPVTGGNRKDVPLYVARSLPAQGAPGWLDQCSRPSSMCG